MEKAAGAITEVMSRTKAADEMVLSKVRSIEPGDRSSEFPITSLVTVKFSEPMSIGAVNSTTFDVRKKSESSSTKDINIPFSPDAKIVRFDPVPCLEPNTNYAAEISRRAKEVGGNALVSTHQW